MIKYIVFAVLMLMLLFSPSEDNCGKCFMFKDIEEPWEYHSTDNIMRVAVKSGNDCTWIQYPQENQPDDCYQVGGWGDVGGLGTGHVQVKVSGDGCGEITQVEFYSSLVYFMPGIFK